MRISFDAGAGDCRRHASIMGFYSVVVSAEQTCPFTAAFRFILYCPGKCEPARWSFSKFSERLGKVTLGRLYFSQNRNRFGKGSLSDLLISKSTGILGINIRNGGLYSQSIRKFGKYACSGGLSSKFYEIPGRDNGFGRAFSKCRAFFGKCTHSAAVFSNANPSAGCISGPAPQTAVKNNTSAEKSGGNGIFPIDKSPFIIIIMIRR